MSTSALLSRAATQARVLMQWLRMGASVQRDGRAPIAAMISTSVPRYRVSTTAPVRTQWTPIHVRVLLHGLARHARRTSMNVRARHVYMLEAVTMPSDRTGAPVRQALKVQIAKSISMNAFPTRA